MKSIRHRFTFVSAARCLPARLPPWFVCEFHSRRRYPPDKEPLKLQKLHPLRGNTKFSWRLRHLHFSEYVQQSKVAENVYLSPPKRLEYSWSGREIEITFAEPLDSATTYALTLGTEYEDLSNNKPTKHLRLFSTGNHLDSGIIRGRLTSDAPSGCLYFYIRFAGINPDTLNPADKPKYRTQKAQAVYLNFALPAGNYRLFAIKDEYKDQLYSVGIDGFGAPLSDITLRRDSIPTVNLRISGAAADISPSSAL